MNKSSGTMNSLWDFLNMMVFGFKWVVNHLAQFFLFLFSYVIAMPKSMYVFTVVDMRVG